MKERKQTIFTWGMIPLSADCPYMFAYYDPEEEVLNLIFHDHKNETLRIYQREDNGEIKRNKHHQPLNPYEEVDEQYYKASIGPEDIPKFLEHTCVNPEENIKVAIENWPEESKEQNEELKEAA